jgi:hypothetical protein
MSGLTSGAPEPGIRTYNPQVRVGNWNEDICLEEDLLNDFLERKANGTLLIQKKAKLRDIYLFPVDLSESTDGYIHFGDTVMIMNTGSSPNQERVLSVYAEDKLNGTLSASDKLTPCARNTFIIRSVDDSLDGKPLRYGQRFRMESVASSKHCLNSEHTRIVAHSRSSTRQSVFLTTEQSSKNQWQIESYEPLLRPEFEDRPVPHGTSLIIKHALTGQALCAEEKVVRTPFGPEKDVNAATIRKNHKNYRAEKWNNHWLLIAGKPKPKN